MGRYRKPKYQRNCAFNLKRKRTTWNRRKDKTMTLDTQVNLPKSDKGSFYNQKEWLEEYEYGKGMFFSEYGDDLRTSASIFSNKFADVKYVNINKIHGTAIFRETFYRCFLHNDHLPYFQ